MSGIRCRSCSVDCRGHHYTTVLDRCNAELWCHLLVSWVYNAWFSDVQFYTLPAFTYAFWRQLLWIPQIRSMLVVSNRPAITLKLPGWTVIVTGSSPTSSETPSAITGMAGFVVMVTVRAR